MIERQFVKQKLKEFLIQEYIASKLAKTGYSHTEVKRTPLGEKVIVYTTRPGLVVGKKGETIQKLTSVLKKKFRMENPQIEIGEVESPYLDVSFVCDKIVSTLERFGSKGFKSVGYKTLQMMMDAGAMGAEIVISGKVPSARARSWRFSAGYLKKSGDTALTKVKRAESAANLKSGVVGVKVSLMLPDTRLPDHIEPKVQEQKKVEIKEEKLEEVKAEIKNEEKPKEKQKERKKRSEVKKENVINKEE
ncbi:MAG: 30S ribosomal protein S3 [Nanoarchaeota archaeon]